MTSADGRLLGWSPATPLTVASAVSGAPSGRSFVITPENHIIMFQVGGERAKWGWCSKQDDSDWNFADPTNTAGSFDVQPASAIVTGALVGEQTLMFTANGAGFVINYRGDPYIYTATPLNECTPPVSADCICATPDGGMWLSVAGFWSFNGVNSSPMACEIWDWISKNADFVLTKFYGAAIKLSSIGEIWFNFVGQGDTLNSFAALYNYRDSIWSQAIVSRICGFSYPSDANPLMSDGTNVYRHEIGTDYQDYSLKPYAETFTINAVSGTNKITLRKMFMEVAGDYDALKIVVVKSNRRTANSSDSVEAFSDPKTIRSNGYVDVRETARDIRIRVEAVSVPTEKWSLGQMLVDVVQRGSN